jgi:DNA-binding CsgD family transcriptional regulator
MHLIEREKHVALLDQLAGRSFAGHGQAALITGAPATGRSALIQAYREQAARAGVVVLGAVGARSERFLPCGVLHQIMQGTALAGDADEIAALLEKAASHGPAGPDGRDPEITAVFHLLWLILRRQAAEHPLLITVDDVAHADDLSLDFLQQLVRRLPTARVFLVLTDTAPAPARSAFRMELDRQPHVHRIELAPLSADGVAAAVRHNLGDAAPEELAAEFFELTGGNPLLLHALLDGPDDPRERLDRYGRALIGCLHRSDPAVTAVANAVAVLGGGTGQALHHLVDDDPQTVNSCLRTMTTAGLMRAGAFRHESARTALLAHMPADERTRLQERAAQVLFDHGAPAGPVAALLIAADSAPPSWAIPVLVEAAEEAVAADDRDTAVSALKCALRGAADPSRAAAVRARLAHIEWEIDPATAARHLDALLTVLRAGQLDHRERFALVKRLVWRGRNAEATEALNLIRSDAHCEPGAVVELRDLEQWLAYVCPTLARHPSGPAPQDGDAYLVRTMTDPWLHATAALTTPLVHGRIADAAAQAAQTLQDLQWGRHTGWEDEAALVALLTLCRADRAHAALQWCDRLRRRTEVQSQRTMKAVLAAANAEICLDLGDLTAAVTHAEAALDQLPARAWGVAAGLPLSTLVLALSRLGQFAEACALLARPVPEAMFQTRYGVLYLFARGQYRMAVRHHHAALADFLSCAEMVRGWGLDAAGLVPWRTSAAEAWLRLGNNDQARRLAGDELSRTGTGARNRAAALRVLAAAGPADRRPQLLSESLELSESCDDRYQQALTLADLASAYHTLDRNRRARVVFRRAIHMALVCEADPLHRKLLAVGNDLGEATAAAPERWDLLDELTDSERRVAALAAMGHTNREIARKLYVTASTVEQHLTRVYRKLKITRRRELPSELTWHAGVVTRASAS